MQGLGRRARVAGTVFTYASLLVLAGCSTSPPSQAPVEDRSAASAGVPGMPVPPITTDASGKPLRGIENYGKPGYYAVRPGDTLIRIGLESGQSWRDLVRWNNLDNPNVIEVGEVLRIIPPTNGATAVAAAPVVPAVVATTPATPSTAAAPAAAAAAAAASAPAVVAAAKPSQPLAADDDLGWMWPARGQLLAGFDDAKNKGLDIGGRAGDPIYASADGKVVYAGAGLRGYGNLIILKHNNTYLTAYAHNQTLLVKEDQSVQKGQKIAEMGSSDADRTKLHFEIRRQGKPVDPARYLPPR
ncbi:peptidoglycan DD-metalloendopeptidase family protein [Variovorax dokdonensis]|uniref:Peptidoglycan DD-metalloendopeptidase family protein n=1 Tax=Variovorax dokdonensis TaxID=344883 RepID=A0ABT7NEI3_9BURK|nr:peptidoglycan DD-metalloendopeptidase family protein [Variovorax dokdonensis]MDM0046341.1 peptidoglycan DD-metalloendopeptidase family protein [Variovorax dokdonensis]